MADQAQLPPQNPPAATEPKKKKKNKKKKGTATKSNTDSAPYFNWLKDNKVIVNNLSLHEFSDTGRGVKAEKKFAVGETVLTVPHTLCVTARSVRANHALKPVFHAFPKTSDDDVLAVFLMYERQLAEKNVASLWTQHIKNQPTTYSNVIYFSTEELNQLKGSNLHTIALQLIQQVQDDYKEFFPKLTAKFPALLDASYFTIEAYKWALSTIWSRAFDLSVKGKRERALVPFSDMFNHSFDAQVDHHFDDKLNALVFKTNKPIEAQDQVFICYDPKIPNIRLLRLYGFCVPKNPNDVVDLYAPLNPSTPHYDIKKRQLTRLAIVDSQSFPIGAFGNIPNSLLNYLRIRRIRDESEMELAKKAITNNNSENMVSYGNESVILMDLQDAIFSMIRAYPTDFDTDIKLLEEMQKSENINFNVKNALMLRINEKNILMEAIVVLDKRASELPGKIE